MANTNIIKSSLVLQYEYGKDEDGNPKVQSQKFSKVNASAEASVFKTVGDALATLLADKTVNVQKQDLISLENLEA